MSNKKNQHFVPKLHLRNFSFEKNNKQIGVYNIHTGFFIQKAKLKFQASKPFFYGKDLDIENFLQIVESDSSTLIHQIIKDNIIPKFSSEEHGKILIYIILLLLRNPILIENIASYEKGMNNVIEKKFPKAKHIGGANSLRDNLPNVFALSLIKRACLYTRDLHFKIIINKSDIKFLTSDNPVIKYNQLLEKQNWINGGTTAFASLGLQYYIALNPETLIMFYDPATYKVGNKMEKTIEVTNNTDIMQLNLLHFLNCNSNVFFNELFTEKIINDYFNRSKKFKKANRVKITEYIDQTNSNHSLISTETSSCEIKLNLSFIKLTKIAKKYKFDKRTIQLRKHFLELDNLKKIDSKDNYQINTVTKTFRKSYNKPK